MNTIPATTNDELYLRLANVARDERDWLWSLYRSFSMTSDPYVEQTLRSQVAAREEQERVSAVEDVFHPSPKHELMTDAEFVIPGLIPATGGLFALNMDDLNANCLCGASTKSGKTNLIKALLMQVLKEGLANVWVFTFEKPATEYDVLKTSGQQVVLAGADELCVNPYELLGSPNRRALQISQLHSHVLGYFLGTAGLEGSAIARFYTEFDSARTGKCPSVLDIIAHLEEQQIPRSDPRSQYRSRLIARLTDMQTALDSIVLCRKGFPIADLAKTNMVISFQNYGVYGELVAAHLIEQLIVHRDLSGESPPPKNVIVFEDSQRVFSRAGEAPGGPSNGVPVSSQWVLAARSRGIHLIVSLQNTAQASRALLQNTGVKFLGRMNDHSNLMEMARSMGCTKQEQFSACQALQTGEFLVSLPRYRTPFLVKIEEV